MPQRPSSKKPGLPVCSSERGRGHQSSDKSVRDRNRKETNTRNKNLLRMPFRVLSCQPPAGDRGKKNQKIKNENPLISMMIFLSSVTGNFTADTLTFTICQTQRSAPMFSVQRGVSCFITNSKCTHVFAICAIYAHRLKSPKS